MCLVHFGSRRWSANDKHIIQDDVDIHGEVKSFFESLDDEGKLLAVNLSLLESWPESDFWRMHKQLTPALPRASPKAVSKKGKKKKKKRKKQTTSLVFGTPKTELLENIRAQSVPLPVRVGKKEHLIQHIEFINDQYAPEIRDHVTRNHPDFLEEMISHLTKLAVEAQDDRDRLMRITTTEAIGLISRAKWLYVKSLIDEWARADASRVRAMVGHVLSRAYTDPEAQIYTTHILQRWANSDNPKLQWTAASTYKEMRWIDLNFALNSLKQIALRLNLSPLKTVLPLRDRSRTLNESQFEQYILEQAGVSLRRTTPEKMKTQIKAYFGRIDEAEEIWDRVKLVYDAVEFAVVVIALDFLKEIINLLRDWANWVNEEDQTTGHTVQLTGSLIWLRLADVMADISREGETPNSILELIDQDEEALDALADLLSGSFVQLFPIQLADKRYSFYICLVLEEWARTEKYHDTVRKLIQRMNGYLSDYPQILKYVEQLLRKRWQSKRMPANVRLLAQSIIQK